MATDCSGCGSLIEKSFGVSGDEVCRLGPREGQALFWCEVCYSTSAGYTLAYDSHVSNRLLLRALAQCTLLILRKIDAREGE